MPELPEVADAVRRIRPRVRGRRIVAVEPLHAATRRALSLAARRRLVGRTITDVTRRGKYQLFVFDDGTQLVAHFRLDGDWVVQGSGAPLPTHARLVIELAPRAAAGRTSRGSNSLILTDPRALATVTWDLIPDIGPEADAANLTPDALLARLASTRTAIKLALLDQRRLAGLGNIYAAEALWRAGIDPRTPAKDLTRPQATHLLRGIRAALRDGDRRAGRYRTGTRTAPFKVYDRAGATCTRCGTAIAALTQGGRTTYWCPGCQRR
ncbi:MAG: Fpg/Nei family DNA glycosylase [Gemmatimonadota bacterium]